MDDGLPRVFTRAEALAARVSDKVLRGPQVHRVFRGVYVRRGVALDTRVRTLAALRLAPEGSVAACSTAAELLGGIVPHETRVHLNVPSGRLRVPGVTTRVRSGRRRLARIGGLPVTTAEDTFVDLAGELGLVDLVVLGDSLVRRDRTTPEALVAAAETTVPPPGGKGTMTRKGASRALAVPPRAAPSGVMARAAMFFRRVLRFILFVSISTLRGLGHDGRPGRLQQESLQRRRHDGGLFHWQHVPLTWHHLGLGLR